MALRTLQTVYKSGQHETRSPHDTQNVMTDTTHTPPHNLCEFTDGSTFQPHRRNTAARRARVRGCGVPATVWFAPRIETDRGNSEKALGAPVEPNTTTDTADRANREWPLGEIVRQFTNPGSLYSIIRLPVADPIAKGTITRHRRAADSGNPSNDPATTTRANHSLVVITGSPDNHRYENDSAHHDGRETPDGMTIESLIKGAKKTLSDGGVLAVQLPRPRPGAGFRDGTGYAIALARQSGLVYLQHIAVVDASINHDGITPALPDADREAFYEARTEGFPVHARCHSDLLIFLKPGKAHEARD